jgi:hypothetical protein
MINTNDNNNKHKEATINFDINDNCHVQGEQPHKKNFPVEAGEWSMHFASFGSGSSGNCAYLGNNREGILIDAGVDMKHVFQDLAHNGITPRMVKGIILTHDHADHIRYAYRIVREHKHMRLYCTPKLMNGLLRHHSVSRRIKEYQEPIFKEIPFKLAGMTITAFETSHDATDNMGFYIEGGGKRFVVGTDMGVIGPRANFYMRQAQYLMIESNYDRSMLDKGHYPEYLKNRVRNEKGHLDNKVTAQFVADIYSPELKYVFLCHLSNDNNTPQIARQEILNALLPQEVTVGDASNAIDQRSRDLQLYVLPRYETSTWFVL